MMIICAPEIRSHFGSSLKSFLGQMNPYGSEGPSDTDAVEHSGSLNPFKTYWLEEESVQDIGNLTDEEIRTIFRDQARRVHPDKNPGDAEAHKVFIQLLEARDILLDPERRKEAMHRYVYKTEAPLETEMVLPGVHLLNRTLRPAYTDRARVSQHRTMSTRFTRALALKAKDRMLKLRSTKPIKARSKDGTLKSLPPAQRQKERKRIVSELAENSARRRKRLTLAANSRKLQALGDTNEPGTAAKQPSRTALGQAMHGWKRAAKFKLTRKGFKKSPALTNEQVNAGLKDRNANPKEIRNLYRAYRRNQEEWTPPAPAQIKKRQSSDSRRKRRQSQKEKKKLKSNEKVVAPLRLDDL